MFIMTQNKTSLVDLNGRAISVEKLPFKKEYDLCVSDTVRSDFEDIFFAGSFESEERAKEVLLDISRALTEGRRVYEIPERR